MGKLGINFGQTLCEKYTTVSPRLYDVYNAGISKQAVSIAVPGVNMSTPENAVTLSRIVNDELSNLAENERFIPLASLPMLDSVKAVEELDRAVNILGIKGVELFTDIGVKPIDHSDFWIIYKRISEHDIPVFIHPNAPQHRKIYDDYNLLAVLGFPFETTHAATRIALSGLLSEISDLKLVLSHLGGTLPYLVGRIDDAYRMFGESQTRIAHPPSQYLRKMYLNGASFYPPAWKFSLDFWTLEKILMGSDYPYGWVNDYHNCISIVKQLELSEHEKDLILRENAENLLGLE